jgi:hypothetical protein
MKDKLLSILDELEGRDLSGFFYSLTIDYVNIVYSFNRRGFDLNDVRKIVNGEKFIKTFNLTIQNTNGDWDESRYEKYWNNVTMIFHSGGIVLDYVSPYLTNSQLPVSDIDKLFRIYERQNLYSKKLYKTIM